MQKNAKRRPKPKFRVGQILVPKHLTPWPTYKIREIKWERGAWCYYVRDFAYPIIPEFVRPLNKSEVGPDWVKRK